MTALQWPTVRSAFLHLSNNGTVVRKRGAGTLVAEEKINRSVELTSLHDDLVAAGRAPTTKVLRNGVTHASERVTSDAADVCQERRDRRGTRVERGPRCRPAHD